MSIYSNPNFQFKTSSQEDYYDSLRTSLEERTALNKGRIKEDYNNRVRDLEDDSVDALGDITDRVGDINYAYERDFSSMSSDRDKMQRDYGRATDDLEKQRAIYKEDLGIGQEELNRQLGQLVKRTYSRYVSTAPSTPTQIGLMSIENKANVAEKERQDVDLNRRYDRSIDGLGDRREDLDYSLDEGLSRVSDAFKDLEMNRDRSLGKLKDEADDITKQAGDIFDEDLLAMQRKLEDQNVLANTSLQGYNLNESDYYNKDRKNIVDSGAAGAGFMDAPGTTKAPLLDEEYKFNSKTSYGY